MAIPKTNIYVEVQGADKAAKALSDVAKAEGDVGTAASASAQKVDKLGQELSQVTQASEKNALSVEKLSGAYDRIAGGMGKLHDGIEKVVGSSVALDNGFKIAESAGRVFSDVLSGNLAAALADTVGLVGDVIGATADLFSDDSPAIKGPGLFANAQQAYLTSLDQVNDKIREQITLQAEAGRAAAAGFLGVDPSSLSADAVVQANTYQERLTRLQKAQRDLLPQLTAQAEKVGNAEMASTPSQSAWQRRWSSQELEAETKKLDELRAKYNGLREEIVSTRTSLREAIGFEYQAPSTAGAKAKEKTTAIDPQEVFDQRNAMMLAHLKTPDPYTGDATLMSQKDFEEVISQRNAMAAAHMTTPQPPPPPPVKTEDFSFGGKTVTLSEKDMEGKAYGMATAFKGIADPIASGVGMVTDAVTQLTQQLGIAMTNMFLAGESSQKSAKRIAGEMTAGLAAQAFSYAVLFGAMALAFALMPPPFDVFAAPAGIGAGIMAGAGVALAATARALGASPVGGKAAKGASAGGGGSGGGGTSLSNPYKPEAEAPKVTVIIGGEVVTRGVKTETRRQNLRGGITEGRMAMAGA